MLMLCSLYAFDVFRHNDRFKGVLVHLASKALSTLCDLCTFNMCAKRASNVQTKLWLPSNVFIPQNSVLLIALL